MSFLDRLFRKKSVPFTRAPVGFGRHNEGLRSIERQSAWDQAMDHFGAERFLDSLESTLVYLNHPEINNVRWTRSNNKLDFTILQGSMEVSGWANPLEIQAQANICTFQAPNEALFRSLLESNYELTFCKYVLQDHTIVLKFNSYALDASPFKFYQGLRELALLADKQDDLLQGEFGRELAINAAWIKPLPPVELDLKREFFQAQLEELAEHYQHCALDNHEYAGAFAYLILNSCYKLDYLLRPEGELMDLFESIHRGYFGPQGSITAELNDRFFKAVQDQGRTSLTALSKECYQVVYTFGYTTDVTLERVQSFILEEVEKMDWYVREGHREIGLAIPGYIVGYSLFHYALPAPLTELFGLFYEVEEYKFYSDLGFTPALIEKGELREQRIVDRIHSILKPSYGRSKEEIATSLRFDSIYHFSKSFLIMVGELNA